LFVRQKLCRIYFALRKRQSHNAGYLSTQLVGLDRVGNSDPVDDGLLRRLHLLPVLLLLRLLLGHHRLPVLLQKQGLLPSQQRLKTVSVTRQISNHLPVRVPR